MQMHIYELKDILRNKGFEVVNAKVETTIEATSVVNISELLDLINLAKLERVGYLLVNFSVDTKSAEVGFFVDGVYFYVNLRDVYAQCQMCEEQTHIWEYYLGDTKVWLCEKHYNELEQEIEKEREKEVEASRKRKRKAENSGGGVEE